MAAPMYNVYVGSETGLFKGINVCKGHWDNLNSLQTADKTKEICSASWTTDAESEIVVGLKNKCVLNFDTSKNYFSDPISLDGGKGNLRNVFKHKDNHITAIDTGFVHIWKEEEQLDEINTGENLHCISHNKRTPNFIGTGGKKTDLKLWDINNTEKPTFTAKNVKNDWLNLEVPVWVTGIDFLQNDKVVTCTGHHQVRVYDPAAQRRPVMDMTFDEYPLTAMSLYNENQVLVGNTQGKMALMDIRKGSMVHLFKGFAGSIRSVQCHPTQPIVATCGLDRFLRIHDINTKALLHKVYLKSKLNCVLLSRKWSEGDDSEDSGFAVGENEEIDDSDENEEQGSDNDEQDPLWGKLEVVQTITVKKGSDVEQDKIVKRKAEEKGAPKTNKKKMKKT